MSLRMDKVQDPIIPQVGAWIKESPGTISLGQGVVHYLPPPQVKEKMTEFWDNPHNHKYSPVGGIGRLQQLIKEKLRNDNNILINEEQSIVVTAGGNMGFLNALFAITEPGDEVIIFSPYYFNHEMAITMLGCVPVCVDVDESFQIDLRRLRARITERTKAIVTVSPNNPTGAVYSPAVLTEINQLCAENALIHISDEAYEYFTYDNVQHFSPASLDDSSSHTITIYSLSKSYGFAGWRIGYMILPSRFCQAVEKAQDTNLICPTVASQFAAIGALEAGASYPRTFIKGLQEVRDLVEQNLLELSDRCAFIKPQGAFYYMIRLDVQAHPVEIVERLIKEHRVAVIPGTAFGKDEGCYLRIAFGALNKDTLEEGIGRLVTGLKALK